MKHKSINVALISAEVKPFSKTGGLADVTGALPPELTSQGHNVTVFTPLHGGISLKKWRLKRLKRRFQVNINERRYFFHVSEGYLDDIVKVYFIDHYDFFRSRKRIYGYLKDGNLRYFFFNKAVLTVIKELQLPIQILHCHDWHTGLIPNLRRHPDFQPYFAETAAVMTIHNIAFQQTLGRHQMKWKHKDDGLGLPAEDEVSIRRCNFMLRGIRHADAISTVSSQYAEEIQTPEFGNGLQEILHKRRRRLFGILNGIDYNHFDPRYDKDLHVRYHLSNLHYKRRNKSFLQEQLGLEVDDNVPIIGMATRITEQKGFELFFEVVEQLLAMHLQVAIVGSGQAEYEQKISALHQKYPEKIGCYLEFSEQAASWVYAGADIFLMPSRFEPCGLGQMIALRYGTIPVVHKVGGLAETIKDYDPATKKGNGFSFVGYSGLEMLTAIVRALETFKYRDRWDKLMRHGMKQSYSWELPARQYAKLYRFAMRKHHHTSPVHFVPHPNLHLKINS